MIFFSALEWKPYNNDKAPEVDGYSIGTNPFGTQSYVGQGIYKNVEFGLGRISIEDPVGFFYLHDTGERRLTSDAKYLSISNGCECNWITSNGESVPYVVTVLNKLENEYYWIGRELYTYKNKNFTLFGEIRYDEEIMRYANIYAEVMTKKPPYEVLTCASAAGL